jgi:DNA-binding transcriptional LysR family regulator
MSAHVLGIVKTISQAKHFAHGLIWGNPIIKEIELRGTARPFHAVADSLLTAVKSPRVDQSTVHRRIQELKRQLGCELVRRYPTGYRLTEMGQYVQACATRVEAAVSEFERAVSAQSNETRGTVKVACPEALGPRSSASNGNR